jgi:hypothetical protein
MHSRARLRIRHGICPWLSRLPGSDRLLAQKRSTWYLTGRGRAGMLEKKVLIDLAPGPNTLSKSPDEKGKVAGFWRGLCICRCPSPSSFPVFNENVHMHEVHNNGGRPIPYLLA